MAVDVTEEPILLMNKLGGLLLLICGVVLMASAYSEGSTGSTTLGLCLAVAGVALLVLKIVRRNQGVEL